MVVTGLLGADMWSVITVDIWSDQGVVLQLKETRVEPPLEFSAGVTSARNPVMLVPKACITIGSGDECGRRLYVH